MARAFRFLDNVGFATKIGGGFAAILLLAAVAGSVGTLTIADLTDQMRTSQTATAVLARLQDVSAARKRRRSAAGPRSTASARIFKRSAPSWQPIRWRRRTLAQR
jgi:methyl-accepting chemotaxis protein